VPNGLILCSTGLVCLLVFTAELVHRPPGEAPALHGWLLLVLGVLCTVTGGVLLWAALFRL
jgi:hypothetical protein